MNSLLASLLCIQKCFSYQTPGRGHSKWNIFKTVTVIIPIIPVSTLLNVLPKS
uniref:Uncharacterized protein n=1 Tax=Anguilla anguilla TaxID=7936 RepID=A0A0E9XJ39_ANGAN